MPKSNNSFNGCLKFSFQTSGHCSLTELLGFKVLKEKAEQV